MRLVRDAIPSPPLSPAEEHALTDEDRAKVAEWLRRLAGYAPQEHDLLRLYLHGKATRGKR
jgi:hypothetical protein